MHFFALLLSASIYLAACASPARLTPYSAGELAARLANEKCQASYGARPFMGEDFEAVMGEDGRWEWGGEERRGVDGFSVSVSFEPDGSRKQVVVDRGEETGNPDGL